MLLKKIPFVYAMGLRLKHSYHSRIARKALQEYLQQPGFKGLQVGAGQNRLQGWYNTDYFPRQGIYFLNTNKTLPMPESSFDYAFSEHHIEHIQYREATLMLKEIYRILKPGGVIRICTPDLNAYMQSYFDPDAVSRAFVDDMIHNWISTGFYNAKNYIPEPGKERVSFFINDIFLNYEHRFIYDARTIIDLLKIAGFSDAYLSEAGKSSLECLNGIEAHQPTPFTLAVEAVK